MTGKTVSLSPSKNDGKWLVVFFSSYAVISGGLWGVRLLGRRPLLPRVGELLTDRSADN